MYPKQQAESLFLNTDKTQTQIADELGISPRTLYRWIQQGRWQQLRSATRRMPSVLVENIYLQLDDLNYSIAQRDRGHRHPTKDESLTISRLMNSIGKVKKETSEGQNIEFLMNLVNYVQPKNDELAKTLTEYGSAFLKDTNPKGFHPYDIEYDNTPPSTEEAPPVFLGELPEGGRAQLAPDYNPAQLELPFPPPTEEAPPLFLGEVPEGGRGQLAPDYNPAQLEIPFPNQNSCDNTSLSAAYPATSRREAQAEAPLAHNNTSLSFGEGRGEAPLAQDNAVTPSLGEDRGEVSSHTIGHNSDIPPTHENPPQPLEDQQQEPIDNTPEMSENNFPAHRTNDTETPPPQDAPMKRITPPRHPVDPKLIYPGSGVHTNKRLRRTLSKEEYDALFRPNENKNDNRRKNKW